MVEVLVPLLATHSGPVGENARPQALTRAGSVTLATLARLETWSTSVNRGAGAPACAGMPSKRTSDAVPVAASARRTVPADGRNTMNPLQAMIITSRHFEHTHRGSRGFTPVSS